MFAVVDRAAPGPLEITLVGAAKLEVFRVFALVSGAVPGPLETMAEAARL